MAKPNSLPLNLQGSEAQADFSYPLSIPSQPPDVKNWFSSYEYESPDSLDIPWGVDSSELLANSDGDTQDPLEISGIQNGTDLPAAKDGGSSFNESLCNESCDQIRLEDDHDILGETGRKCGGCIQHFSPISFGKSIVDLKEFLERPLARLNREHNLQQAKNDKAENDDKLDIAREPAKSNVEDDMLQNKQVFFNSTDGFISTRKREIGRSIPSNSISMNRKNKFATNELKVSEDHGHLIREDMKENDGILARREQLQEERASALADRTNIQVEPGIPGKWQCPRKRKPYIGPPLKQLRLEQWVRRVN